LEGEEMQIGMPETWQVTNHSENVLVINLVCSLQNGTLKIIDRKKHIFKLSQGEYIVPEKIENIYIRSQYVQQVFVCGESLKVSCQIFYNMA
jgi:hypothetical protein